MPLVRGHGVTYGFISALAWGISTIAAAQAARRVGTYTALLVSQLLGAAFLGVLAVILRPSLAGLHGLTLLGLIGAGLLGLIGWLTYYRALEDGPVGLVSALASTYGGVAAVLAVVFLGENLALSGGVGVVLAIAGIAMAAAQSPGPGGGRAARPGIVLALVSALTYGAGSFLLGGFSPHVGWLAAALVAYGSSVTALIAALRFRRAGNGRAAGAVRNGHLLAATVLWPGLAPVHHDRLDGDWSEPAGPAANGRAAAAGSPGLPQPPANGSREHGADSAQRRAGYLPGLGWAAGAGLTEAVALAAFSRGGQAGQVAVTAAVSSLYPVIPLAAGLVLFGERLRWRQVLGVACIVAGLVMISLGKNAMGMMLTQGEGAMRNPLVPVSVILSLAGTVPILVQVLRGKARPQPVSWGLWAGLMVIGGLAALDGGHLPAAAYGLACGAECALVAVLALRIPAAEREAPVLVPLWRGRAIRLDLICLAGGLAGLAQLAVVRAPGAAVAATVATDLIAYVPTWANAWKAPDDEVATGYALYAAGAAVALAAVVQSGEMLVFAAVAYPLYLAVADGAAAVLIVARRFFAASAQGPDGVLSEVRAPAAAGVASRRG